MGTSNSDPALTPAVCRWCSTAHDGEHCPLVKAYNIDVAGNIVRVEFLTPSDYPNTPIEAVLPDYPRKGE